MIHVDRAAGPAPGAPWVQRALAAEAEALLAVPPRTFDRDVYGHPDVRAALAGVFHEKCAYCESPVPASSDWEVEHFRPKGRVAGRPGHPGYFWLAYTWENLYLACTHCNQRRRDREGGRDARTAPAKGKHDQFPLSDESTRVCGPAQGTESEARLLVDPCADDPEAVLAVGVKGQLVAIDENGRACATRDVCNLDRGPLRRAREQRVLELLTAVDKFRPLAPRLSRREVALAVLPAFAADASPYALVARSILRDPAAFGLN